MVRPSLILLLLALGGCQTTSPQIPAVAPPAGMATITITRSSDLMYFGAPAQIDVNGESVGSLAVGGNYSGSLRPGPVIIATSAWSAPGRYSVRFEAEPGKTYRFLISPRGEQMAAGLGGGLIGQVIEGGGPFKIAPVN